MILKLFRPILSFTVALSTLAGYFIANGRDLKTILLLFLTSFIHSSGCSAINQAQESDIDCKMERCRKRPIPSGLLSSNSAFFIGITLLIVSFFIGILINLKILTLLIINVIIYNILYTYLKRITSFFLLLGGVAGILPPLMGWVAMKNFSEVDIYFVTFIAIIYVWQVAHFFLIVKIHETDYKNANLPIIDLMGKNFNIILIIWIICYYFLIIYHLFLKPTNNGSLWCLIVIITTFIFLIISENNRHRFYTLNFTIILIFLNTII